MKRNIQILHFKYHFAFWVTYWFFLSLLWSNGKYFEFYLVKNVAIVSIQIMIVYINFCLFFPFLFQKKRYVLYVLASILLIYTTFILSFTWIEWIVDYFRLLLPQLPDLNFPPIQMRYPFWTFLSDSAPYSLALVCSLVVKVYRENEKNKARAVELEIQKARTEIQYLRSQISPHFLFNSLNNIHLLILKNQQIAANYTVLLSNLLRYMLYESKKEQTILEKELECVNNYLSLIEIRMEDTAHKKLEVSVENTKIPIAPLLLVSLLENGIKHSGILYLTNAYLEFSITQQSNQLIIQMRNSIDEATKTDNSLKSGIGLYNLKKRLALNYPDKHRFTLKIEEKIALTELIINLQEK